MISNPSPTIPVHLLGEPSATSTVGQIDTVPIQLPGGVFRVRLDPDVQVSQLGGIVPFGQFLETSGVFTAWVHACPLYRTSPNASSTRDVLGTMLIAVASGQSRYAHITGVRGDQVMPEVLGIHHLVSEDTVRRGLGSLVGEGITKVDKSEQEVARKKAIDATTKWSQDYLLSTVSPLLSERWIMDMDVTVKTLYGHQEGAKVNYNPHKPGRPSHAIHTFIVAQTRLVIGVELHPGDEHSAADTKLDLTHILGKLPREQWPWFLRGDCAYGTENLMSWPESNGLDYLFKIKKSKNTQKHIDQLDHVAGWIEIGDGWQANDSRLRLTTWSRERRVVVLRRIKKERYPDKDEIQKPSKTPKQEILEGLEALLVDETFEYHVLVTSLTLGVAEIARLYRQRADAENVFDELKNHWGWGGFTSRSFAVSQLAVRIVAQIYNWWSIFVRILSPDHHREAVTSRPALLHSIVKQTKSSGQRILTITSTHNIKDLISKSFTKMAQFFVQFDTIAEQLPWQTRWTALLKAIFQLQKPRPAT